MNRSFSRLMSHCAAASLALIVALALVSCGGQSPQQLLEEAGVALENQNIMAAELKFSRVLEKFPEAPEAREARYGLALTLVVKRDFERAREQFDILLEQMGGPASEESFQVWQSKLSTYQQEGVPERAIAEIVETSPTLSSLPMQRQVQAQMMLASFHMFAEQPEQAVQIARAAIKNSEEEWVMQQQILQFLQQIHLSQQDTQAAYELFEWYGEEYPESPFISTVLHNKGLALKNLERPEEAEAAFDKSEALLRQRIEETLGAEQKVQMMLNLATMLRGRGKTAEAQEVLKEIQADYAASQNAPMALMLMADILAQQGEFEQAQTLLRELVDKYPQTQLGMQAGEALQQVQQARMRQQATTPTQDTATTGGLEAIVADEPAPLDMGDAETPAIPAPVTSPSLPMEVTP